MGVQGMHRVLNQRCGRLVLSANPESVSRAAIAFVLDGERKSGLPLVINHVLFFHRVVGSVPT